MSDRTVESKIIVPAIRFLKKKHSNVFGPYSADSIFNYVNDYYPFIWQAGDKLVFGVNFTHSDVNLGTLTDSTSDNTLSNLPFKFTVELV